MTALRALSCVLAALAIASRSATSLRSKQGNFRVIFRVQRFEDCGKPESYMHLQKPAFMFLPDGSHAINFNFTGARTLQNIREIRLTIHRCHDYASENTCEYYGTRSVDVEVCSVVLLPNVAWTPLVKSISPPLKCPLKQGLYMARNATFNLNDPMVRTLVGGYVWKTQFSIYDQDKTEAFCSRSTSQGIKTRGGKS